MIRTRAARAAIVSVLMTTGMFRMLTGAGGVDEHDFFSRDRLVVLLVATLGGIVIAAVTLDFPRRKRAV